MDIGIKIFLTAGFVFMACVVTCGGILMAGFTAKPKAQNKLANVGVGFAAVGVTSFLVGIVGLLIWVW